MSFAATAPTLTVDGQIAATHDRLKHPVVDVAAVKTWATMASTAHTAAGRAVGLADPQKPHHPDDHRHL